MDQAPDTTIREILQDLTDRLATGIHGLKGKAHDSLDRLVDEYLAASRDSLVEALQSRLTGLVEVSSHQVEDITRLQEQIREQAEQLESRGEQLEELEGRAGWLDAFVSEVPALCEALHQKQILEKLLDLAALVSPRCLLLVLREGRATIWSGRGFGDSAVADALGRHSFDVADDPVLAQVGGQGEVAFVAPEVLAEGQPLFGLPALGTPQLLVLTPLTVFGNVSAVVFLDGDALVPGDEEAVGALRLLAQHAGLWIENVTMRRTLGLTPGVVAPAPVPAPAVEQDLAAPIVEEVAVSTVAASEEPTPVVTEVIPEPEPMPAPPAQEEFVVPAQPEIPSWITDERLVPETVEEEIELAPQEVVSPVEPEEIQIEEVVTPDFEVAPSFSMPEPELQEIVVEEEAPALSEMALPPTQPLQIPVEPIVEPEEIVLPTEPEEIVLEEEVLQPEEFRLEEPAAVVGPDEPLDLKTMFEPKIEESRFEMSQPESAEIVLEESSLEELIQEQQIPEPTPVTPASFVIPEPVPAPAPEPAPAAQAQPWTTPEEERLHNDARRFARLLVSEIKLYNEDAVTEGRIDRDLYQRLKRDIDRSREMYDKRVAPEVARTVDYFDKELVRILCDGEAGRMGAGYGGPRLLD